MPPKSEDWIPCTKPEVGDILRWTEPLFAPPSKKRGKPNKMGDQQVTAELLSIGEFYELYVMEVFKVAGGGTVKVKEGDQIRRKATSIAMGDCYKKRNPAD